MTLASGLSRASLLAVIVVPLAWVLLYPPFRGDGGARGVRCAHRWRQDAERTVLRIDGDDAGVAVAFPHADHQRRLGGRDSCGTLPSRVAAARTTPRRAPAAIETWSGRPTSSTTTLTSPRSHGGTTLGGWIPGNQTCRICHAAEGPKGTATARPCLDCHEKDMAPSRRVAAPLGPSRASGYRVALHENCVACHKEEAARQGRPVLAECSTCHETLRRRESPGPTPSPSLVAARLP